MAEQVGRGIEEEVRSVSGSLVRCVAVCCGVLHYVAVCVAVCTRRDGAYGCDMTHWCVQRD